LQTALGLIKSRPNRSPSILVIGEVAAQAAAATAVAREAGQAA